MWLSVLEEAAPYREFSLLTLFPRHDIQDSPPFVQLGTQFLLAQRAGVQLDCSSVAAEGRIVIP
jgi:hypothetical protein